MIYLLFWQGQKKHCKVKVGGCDGIYNVKCDIERYCWVCNNWFHIRCIKKGKMDRAPAVDEILGFQHSFPNPVGDGISWEKVSMAPIERGGRFGVAGNGQMQLLIRKTLKSAGEFNPLVEEIEPEYIESVSTALFDYFDCLDCGNAI
jgi:hypothetical protein